MTDASLAPQWIDVSQADDLRDVIHRAVACLAQGGVVGLATETVYALAAFARVPAAWPGCGCCGHRAEPTLDAALERSRGGHRLGTRDLASGASDGLEAMAGPATLVFARHMADGLDALAGGSAVADFARRRRRVAQPGASDRP